MTFTATVVPVSPGSGTPTGTVAFYADLSLLGTATLAGGVASISTSVLSIGDHTIWAAYGGDGNFNSSADEMDYTVAGVTGIPIEETEGHWFDDNIATVVLPPTDTNPDDYTVQIAWTPTTVSYGYLRSVAGTVYVSGYALYDDAGVYPISISITGSGGYTLSGSSTATIDEVAVVLQQHDTDGPGVVADGGAKR